MLTIGLSWAVKSILRVTHTNMSAGSLCFPLLDFFTVEELSRNLPRGSTTHSLWNSFPLSWSISWERNSDRQQLVDRWGRKWGINTFEGRIEPDLQFSRSGNSSQLDIKINLNHVDAAKTHGKMIPHLESHAKQNGQSSRSIKYKYWQILKVSKMYLLFWGKYERVYFTKRERKNKWG